MSVEMSFFFVGGSQRTGTYLLQSILCSDKTTNPIIREAVYLRSLVDQYTLQKANFDRFNKDYFSDFADFKSYSRASVNTFLEISARTLSAGH